MSNGQLNRSALNQITSQCTEQIWSNHSQRIFERRSWYEIAIWLKRWLTIHLPAGRSPIVSVDGMFFGYLAKPCELETCQLWWKPSLVSATYPYRHISICIKWTTYMDISLEDMRERGSCCETAVRHGMVSVGYKPNCSNDMQRTPWIPSCTRSSVQAVPQLHSAILEEDTPTTSTALQWSREENNTQRKKNQGFRVKKRLTD